jgi:hypothetical protein
MSRWVQISCLAIFMSVCLGACSSSYDGLRQADLAAEADDTCQSGVGPASGMAALNGAQASYAQCMQQRFAAGPAGYQEGSFAPGSNPASLAAANNR